MTFWNSLCSLKNKIVDKYDFKGEVTQDIEKPVVKPDICVQSCKNPLVQQDCGIQVSRILDSNCKNDASKPQRRQMAILQNYRICNQGDVVERGDPCCTTSTNAQENGKAQMYQLIDIKKKRDEASNLYQNNAGNKKVNKKLYSFENLIIDKMKKDLELQNSEKSKNSVISESKAMSHEKINACNDLSQKYIIKAPKRESHSGNSDINKSYKTRSEGRSSRSEASNFTNINPYKTHLPDPNCSTWDNYATHQFPIRNQKPKTPYSIISPTSMTQKNEKDAQPVHNPDAHLWAATQDTTEENNVEVQAPASPQSFYWTPPASHQYQVNPETAPSPHISTWGNPFSPQYRENAQGYDQIETQTSANPQTSYWPTSAAEPFQMKPNSAANPYVSNWTTPMPQQYQANTQSVNNPNVQFWNNPNSQEYHIKAQNSADPHTSHWTPPATEALQMTTPTTANITEMKNPKTQQYQMRSQSSVNPQVSSWTDSGTELVQIRTKKEANLHITTRTFPQQYQGEVQPLTNTMLPTWTKSTTKSYQVRTQTAAYPNVTSRTRPDRVKPGPQSSDTSSHTHKNKMAYRLCELAVSDPIVQIMVNEVCHPSSCSSTSKSSKSGDLKTFEDRLVSRLHDLAIRDPVVQKWKEKYPRIL